MKKLLLCWALVGSVLALGAQTAGTEARTALLIANGAYTNFSRLPNPIPEAQQLKGVLEGLGFSVSLVTDASKEQMQEAILDFETRVRRQGGIAFFHYGGHAVQVQGKNWLIPATANIPDEARVRIHGVDVEEITSSLDASGASTSIVILDSCRDNPLPGSGRSATRGLTVLGANPRNSIVVYSAQAGSTARDGVFTPALIRALPKQMSLTEVIQEVRREVNSATGGQQTPGAYDQLFTPVYLAGRPSAVVTPTPAAPAVTPTVETGRVRFEAPIPGLVYLGSEIIGEVGPDRPLAAEGLPVGRQSFQFVSDDEKVRDTKSVLVTARGTNTLQFAPPAATSPAPVAASATRPTATPAPTPANPVIAPTSPPAPGSAPSGVASVDPQGRLAIAPKLPGTDGDFVVEVRSPMAGLTVKLNGLIAGTTPFTGRLQRGTYDLEIVPPSPEYEGLAQPLRPSADLAAPVVIDFTPPVSPGGQRRVWTQDLERLEGQRRAVRDTGATAAFFSNALWWVGWAGLGTAAGTIYNGFRLREVYDTGGPTVNFAKVREDLAAMNRWAIVGLSAWGAGWTLGWLTGLAVPSTPDLDRAIDDLNAKLRALGGN